MREFVQGPGETIYMPGNLAHAVLNVEDSVSVTENYLLEDSLDDWVHGMLAGEELLDGHYNRQRAAEFFWKAMYYKVLTKEQRLAARKMKEQVEQMIDDQVDVCIHNEELNSEVLYRCR